MRTPKHRNSCPGDQEIYNFDKPFQLNIIIIRFLYRNNAFHYMTDTVPLASTRNLAQVVMTFTMLELDPGHHYHIYSVCQLCVWE